MNDIRFRVGGDIKFWLLTDLQRVVGDNRFWLVSDLHRVGDIRFWLRILLYLGWD